MRFSNSGRIIIIDDNRAEAQPLLDTLGKVGIPYIYFDGSADKLPEKPLSGVRFVFLDIELQGMSGQDEKTKASGLTARLKALISEANGPYAVFFWTKHSEVIDQILKNCETAKIPPTCSIDLEKASCVDAQGNYDLKALSGKLKEQLNSTGAFRLYVEWENILHESTKDFVVQFSDLAPKGAGWSDGTSAIFYKLYKSYVEKNDLSDADEQFKCACLLMNRCFLDALQGAVTTTLRLPDGFKLRNDAITEETVARLNSSLFLSRHRMPRPNTGATYLYEDAGLLRALTEKGFKKDKAPANTLLCKIIITPECDLAQNKMLKIRPTAETEHGLHRVIHGLLFPWTAALENDRKTDESQFDVGPIWYKDKPHKVVFFFSTLSSLHEGIFSKEAIFILGHDLVFDLQSKAANNVNRLGNSLLK